MPETANGWRNFIQQIFQAAKGGSVDVRYYSQPPKEAVFKCVCFGISIDVLFFLNYKKVTTPEIRLGKNWDSGGR